jgi:hypothetical protein
MNNLSKAIISECISTKTGTIKTPGGLKPVFINALAVAKVVEESERAGLLRLAGYYGDDNE